MVLVAWLKLSRAESEPLVNWLTNFTPGNVGSGSQASFGMYFILRTCIHFNTTETIGCQTCRGVALKKKRVL